MTSDQTQLAANTPANGSTVRTDDFSEPGTVRYDLANRIVPIVPPPEPLSTYAGKRWTLVKAARDQAEWWGCSTPLGRADTDPESQRKVSGAVQLAMIAQAAGQSFAIDWTMQDNSTVAHDASAMIAMGVAVGQHVAACHEVALAKRVALEAAADAAGVDAVDVEGGWPDAPPTS
nr:DUF4376 domain-containing protein [Sphingomonas beigongshangi]